MITKNEAQQGSLLIQNATVVFEGKKELVADFAVKDGRIVGKISRGMAEEWEGPILQAEGLFLAPGFVDLHVHGGGGSDFMDGTEQAIANVCATHARHGTTAMLATAKYEDENAVGSFFKAYEAIKRTVQGCRLVGVHLEGPYLMLEQAPGWQADALRPPCREEYEKILAVCPDILRWSIAPELEGALELGADLSRRGIVASVAHSNATSNLVQQAAGRGYSLVTHLYMGMSIVRRVNGFRVGGVVEAAFLLDQLTVEVVADGKNLPHDMLRMIHKIKGSDKMLLASNAIRTAGVKPAGADMAGNEGAMALESSLPAGSNATADFLLQTVVKAGIPLEEGVRMLTETPAKVIGKYPEVGSLETGAAADLVLFNQDCEIQQVYMGGKKFL